MNAEGIFEFTDKGKSAELRLEKYFFTKEKNEMNITVYLGANEGNNPSLKRAVKELGTWIWEKVATHLFTEALKAV